jgi:hypothetical protein
MKIRWSMQSNSHPHEAMMTTSQWYGVTPSKTPWVLPVVDATDDCMNTLWKKRSCEFPSRILHRTGALIPAVRPHSDASGQAAAHALW